MHHRPHSPANSSPFIDSAAVEAWDAWFRWREGGELRDTTFDSTLQRVVLALAPAESAAWREQLLRAFGEWQLLLDQRILASAGTPAAAWPSDDLVGVLNLAAFVRAPFSRWAQVASTELEATAALAVTALDLAARQAGATDVPPRLRIGVIGLADALALLDLSYDSTGARTTARRFIVAITRGAWQASLQLAQGRSQTQPIDAAAAQRARACELDPGLLAQAERDGLAHAALTAIDSQARLALLANNVTDAVDPLCTGPRCLRVSVPGGERSLRSPGYATSLYQQRQGNEPREPLPRHLRPGAPLEAQIAMRATLAPLLDAPLDYPFRVARDRDIAGQPHWVQLCADARLPAPRWCEE